MASQNFQELHSATTSMGSIIDVRVIASFDFVVTRDWVTNESDNKTPKLRSVYEPFLRFFIAYNAETKSVIPVFKNIRRQCVDNFAVLATDICSLDTSFIDFTKLENMEGDDPTSDAANPIKVDGKLAHIRCMEQNCPKRYYPGEHVKVYESFETAKPLRLTLSIQQSAYLHWVVYAAVNFSKKYEKHDLHRFPPYDEYSGKKTLGYLIDLDQKVAYYPSVGETVPIYSTPLPTVLKGKENSIVGPARIYLKQYGDRVETKDVREKVPGALNKDEMESIFDVRHVLEFKHFVLDNGEEDLHIENKSSCSSCIDINYDEGCANGIGNGGDEMDQFCHDGINHVRRKCYHSDESTMGGASYLKIYTKEYLSCWSVGEEIYIKGEHKDISGKPKTIRAIVKHKGTDRWARNWIKVESPAKTYLNLKQPLKLIHACSQIYDTEERTICFCDCNGHSVKMKVLVTEDLSTYESCQGSGTSLGVCCINGLCSEISRQACEAANGTWIDDKTCNDATPPCSEALGICCVGAVCSITTQLSCDNANGLWKPATPENPASCDDPENPCAGTVILKLTNGNGDTFKCGTPVVSIVPEAEGPQNPGSLAVVLYEGLDTPISNKIFFDSIGHFATRQKTISLIPGKIWTDITYATAYSTWACSLGGGIVHRQYDIITFPGPTAPHRFEWFLTMHN